jgi:hypothetical protein
MIIMIIMIITIIIWFQSSNNDVINEEILPDSAKSTK